MICFNSLLNFFLWRSKYQEIYQRSIKDAKGFWSEVANDVFWYKKPTKILNSDNPPFLQMVSGWNHKHLL